MKDERLQSIVRGMIQQPSALAPQQQLADALFEPLTMAIQQLEQGLIQIAQGQQAQGYALDITRLTLLALLELLIEKGFFSKEEWDERYQHNVVARMEAIREQVQEKIRQHIEAQEQEDTGKEAVLFSTEEDTEETKSSNIVLPSEKYKGVVKFPKKE